MPSAERLSGIPNFISRDWLLSCSSLPAPVCPQLCSHPPIFPLFPTNHFQFIPIHDFLLFLFSFPCQGELQIRKYFFVPLSLAVICFYSNNTQQQKIAFCLVTFETVRRGLGMTSFYNRQLTVWFLRFTFQFSFHLDVFDLILFQLQYILFIL